MFPYYLDLIFKPCHNAGFWQPSFIDSAKKMLCTRIENFK